MIVYIGRILWIEAATSRFADKRSNNGAAPRTVDSDLDELVTFSDVSW